MEKDRRRVKRAGPVCPTCGRVSGSDSQGDFNVDSGRGRCQRAIDLTGTLLTIAEDATNRDLMSNQTLTHAVGAVIDAEVALRNAHAALAAVVEDLRQGPSPS